VTSLIEWLLDLESIRLGRDAPLMLEWQGRAEAWMLVGFALAAVAWVGLIYRREQVSAVRRWLLAAVRCAVIALVVAMLCRPVLVLQRNRVEPSHVTLLVDASQSMAAQDHYEDEALARRLAAGAGLATPAELAQRSRFDLLRAGLTRDAGLPLRKLLEHNVLHIASFAGEVTERGAVSSADSVATLLEALNHLVPNGARTDVAGALGQVIEHAQGRPLAAVVLATDGQTTEPTSLRDVLALARGRQIPIFPIRIGDTARPWDIDVGPILSESTVFLHDLVALEVQLTARGLVETRTATVNLVDERSGARLDSRTVAFEPEQTALTVELHAKPDAPGIARYRVEVSPLPDEQSTDNNADRAEVLVVDTHLRVLYVDGYPRFEYRYAKNALMRERGIDLSVLLLEADEHFVQEGTDPIRRFPETPEELNRYDVVLFGDVDPRSGWLTIAQMNMLVDFVGNEGGGFGLIAGERYAPQRFVGTPLDTLLPVRIDPEFTGRYAAPLSSGFRLQLTPDGRRSRLFRSVSAPPPGPEPGGEAGDADNAGDTVVALFESLPEQYWIARTLGPKPGASVLAEHPTLQVVSGRAVGSGLMPLVVVGRYGAGRVFFQATDDTWRWRRHTGELLHDTYWVQVARELMRSERVSQNRRLVLRTERRSYEYGVAVHAQVDVFDTQLLAEQPQAIELSVWDRSTAAAAEAAGDGFLTAHLEAQRLGGESRRYEGTFIPPRPGRYQIRVEGVALLPGERPATASIRVERPDLEARRPEANHEVLERVAAATGGQVLELDALEQGFAAIRDRSVRIPDDVTEPLWDSKLVLMLFVLMITVEWVARKAFGLI